MQFQELINWDRKRISEQIAELAIEYRRVDRNYCRKLIQLAREVRHGYGDDHLWGHWPDKLFNQVEHAAREIGQFCGKWGRIGVMQTKEKYGRCAVYCHFGIHQLFSITHPGYAYSRYPQWLWNLDTTCVSRVFEFLRINKLVIPYQRFVYRLAYNRALKKYPLIQSEILNGADYIELLAPLFKKYNVKCTWQRLNAETGKWEPSIK